MLTAMKTPAAHWLLLGLVLLGSTCPAQAQSKYLTKTGTISFFSASPIEDIEARNQQAAAVLDLATSQVAFTVPIKGFVFKRTLMQEHFNENYLESDKFPKATFTGRFTGFDASATSSRPVQVEGDLTIHGVTRKVQVPGTLELKGNQLVVFASFPVATADYNIEIPFLVRDHIAKVITVKVSLMCDAVAPTTSRTGSN